MAVEEKVYSGIEDGTFGTLEQIKVYMIEHNIPLDAVLEYAGCGSHRIMFVWNVETEAEKTERVHP